MPMTATQVGDGLKTLLVDLINETITPAEFATGYAELWTDATTGGATTGALGARLSAVLEMWNGNQVQLAAWAAGTATFESDDPDQPEVGWYPLTNYLGITRWEPSPARLRSIIAKGDQGDRGAGIISGHGAPAGGTGTVDDIYIDLDTGDFYGPKHAVTGWGSPVLQTGLLAVYADTVAARDTATAAAATATGAAATAVGAADAADDSATAAAASAATATGAAGTATGAATTATGAAGTATGAATTATTAKDDAVAAKNLAQTLRDEAEVFRNQAEVFRDEAQTISGADYVPNSQKGAANGVATLGSDGLVPAAQSRVVSVAGKAGEVELVKADVGLDNVSNLAPSDLPISTATQAALDEVASSATDPKAITRILLEIAQLKGNQVGLPNGIADDFADADGVVVTGGYVDTAGKRIVVGGLSAAFLTAATGNADGSIVTSSGDIDSTRPAWRAFDGQGGGNADARWEASTANVGWVRRQWPAAKTWTHYTIRSNGGPESTGNNIKSWRIRGSNDGLAWTDIDTRANVANWAEREARTYQIATPGAYLYYEIVIDAVQTAGSRPTVTELLFSVGESISATNSNDAPDGSVVSASSVFNATYQAFKAFNGVASVSSTDYWAAANGSVAPWWLRRMFLVAKQITSYVMTTINTSVAGNENYSPKSWTIRGSNNGIDWTTIDTRTSVPNWAQGETRTYAIASPGSYKYYEILITAVQGGAGFIPCIQELVFRDSPALAAQVVPLTASAAPLKASVLFVVKSDVAFTLNTDLVAKVSRTGGADWLTATLVQGESIGGGYVAYEATNISLASLPSGTSPRWRLEGTGGKGWDIGAAALLWS